MLFYVTEAIKSSSSYFNFSYQNTARSPFRPLHTLLLSNSDEVWLSLPDSNTTEQCLSTPAR